MGLLIKLLCIAIPAFILNGSDAISLQQVTIEGVVLNKQTSQPISSIYVYIIAGEEEALTDSKGKFTIHTWQSFPLTLKVDAPKYKKTNILVNKPGTKHFIQLETR